MLYNWTLHDIFTSIKDKSYEFREADNPFDLSEIINEPWIKDAIERGYFVPNDADKKSADSEASVNLG